MSLWRDFGKPSVLGLGAYWTVLQCTSAQSQGGYCAGNLVVADGDSLTFNTGEVTNTIYADRYSSQALSTMSPLNVLQVTAVGGFTCQNIIDHIASIDTPLFWTARNIKVYSFQCGTNDFAAGLTAAQIYTKMQAICAAINAMGIPVIISNKLPSGFAGNSTANISALNALIAGGGACPMTIADVASDPNIGQPGDNNNATYYLDAPNGTHLTVAGNAIWATYYKTALQSLGLQ